MTDTQPKNAETVQDTPLTIREHLDPDKHWIGESLAPPSQGEIEATVGTNAGPGESPFVARADHRHKIDPSLLAKTGYATGSVQTTSGATALTVCSAVVPARPLAGLLMCWSLTRIQKSVATDIFQVVLGILSPVATMAQMQTYTDQLYEWPTLNGAYNLAANTEVTVRVYIARLSGTGTGSTVGNYSDNHIGWIYIPTTI